VPLPIEQQVAERLRLATRILLVTREQASIDSLAATFALARLLQQMGKRFDLFVPGFQASALPAFLPAPTDVRPEAPAMRALHLQVDLSKTPLAELSYDVHEQKLDVTLIPKQGEWSEADVLTKPGHDRFDLVVAVDVPDRASLGTFSEAHADFLHRTPLVNLDCHPGNEGWGSVNFVDVTCVSTTELLWRWMQALQNDRLIPNGITVDEPLATALLAGMVAKTRSFRTANVTPKTLATAAKLVSLGAKREEIVHGLWRQRDVNVLKLWGRALTRLEHDRDLGLVWSQLHATDFLDTGVGPEAADGVVEELITYAPEARVTALLLGTPDGLTLRLHARGGHSALDLLRPFNGHGSRDVAEAKLTSHENPLEAGRQALYRLRATLQRLS
jgi:phosphoesterase RecJ-like protein